MERLRQFIGNLREAFETFDIASTGRLFIGRKIDFLIIRERFSVDEVIRDSARIGSTNLEQAKSWAQKGDLVGTALHLKAAERVGEVTTPEMGDILAQAYSVFADLLCEGSIAMLSGKSPELKYIGLRRLTRAQSMYDQARELQETSQTLRDLDLKASSSGDSGRKK